jgi:hypothetical protein
MKVIQESSWGRKRKEGHSIGYTGCDGVWGVSFRAMIKQRVDCKSEHFSVS